MSRPRIVLRSFALPSLITLLLHVAQRVRGELRFIDDTYGDLVTGAQPSYSSGSLDCWDKGPGCSACTLQPQASQAYNGTWHDTTSDICNNSVSNNGTAGHSVTFTFNGTSLNVYCITVASGPTVRDTTLSFSLDGNTNYAQFMSTCNNGDAYNYQYNTPVFTISSLSNTQHTFVMTAVQGSSASALLFDYATYDYEPISKSPLQSTNSLQSSSGNGASTSLSSTSSRSLGIGSSIGGSISTSSSSASSLSNLSTLTAPSHTRTGSEASPYHTTAGSLSLSVTATPSVVGAVQPANASESHTNTTVVAAAAAGGSIVILGIIAIVLLLCARRKAREQKALVTTSDVPRKSRYDFALDDDDDNGYIEITRDPLGGPNRRHTQFRLGNVLGRSHPTMVTTDVPPASRCSTLIFSANTEHSTANLLGKLSAADSSSAEIDARSVLRQSSGMVLRQGPIGGSDQGHGSSAGHGHQNRESQRTTMFQTQIETLRQDMEQEIARLREQTEAIAMVPPPAYT